MDRSARFKKEMIDLYSEVDLRSLLERITAALRGYLACEEASIFIYDPGREELSFETATGAKAEQLKRIVLKKGEGVAGWIAAERRGVIIDDCARDKRHAAAADQRTSFRTRSLLGTPVLQGGRLLGVLEAVNKKRGRFSRADLRLLQEIASFLAIPLQNAVLIRQMLEKEKLERELQVARDIQRTFLRQEPLVLPGYDVAFLNLPCSGVGGDYYEAMALAGGRAVFAVGDVAGHGVPAALGMAIFRSSFVHLLRQGAGIAAAIGHLNRLIAETTEANLYVTACACQLDAGGRGHYLNAGHPPPLLLRDGKAQPLAPGGMAVGIFPEAEFPVAALRLRAGDLLLLFTDGVIEAADELGREYGRRRLERVARRRRRSPAAALLEAVLADVRAFRGCDEFEDDLTLMAIKYIGKNELS